MWALGSGEVEVTGVLRTWGVWYWWFFERGLRDWGGGDEGIYCRRVL